MDNKKNTIHAIPALLLSLTLSAAMLTVSCTQRNCRTAERQAVATAQRDTTATDTVQTATGSSQQKQQAAAPATSTRRSNVAGKHLSDLTRRTVRKFFSNADSDTLSVGRARLAVPREAMKSGRVLSITPLKKGELPDLPAGLVNVTGGCDTLLAQTDTVSGYRFLPHGEHF